MSAYVSSDFTNFNVFENSHSSKPLIYKIAGTWGNHEGSMLLWLLIMNLYTLLFSFNKTLDEDLKKLTLFFQSLLYLFFALFVIFTSNPFLVNSIIVNEGLGLNPILQDPALAIHPPMLYLGYVGFSLVLSLSIAGSFLNKINSTWVKTTKNWTLFCWSMLAAGIGLGSYWAYYELGWGGWWFWDPVENVSLMPWIAGLALVHSLMITQKNHLLKRWIVFLSILCFSLSIFGTFLVRSGILTSVHSFATDPSRGIFILILFLIITGFSFIVFIFKSKDENKKLNLLFINKQSALLINNIVMLIACLTILLGTIYPIIIEVISGKRISVGTPYFNATVLPILLPGFLLMSVAPALSWQSNKLPKYKIYLIIFILMSVLTAVFSYITNFNTWGFVGITLSLLIIGSSIANIYFNYIRYKKNNFFIHNNSSLAHFGVGIAILGITCSSVFQAQHQLSISKDELLKINNYSLKLANIEIYEKENFQELKGKFILLKNSKKISIIEPSKRYYHVSKIITTEAGIYHDWFQDFYIVLGNQKDNKWDVKIYQNPLVSFIWIGLIIMFLCGLVGIRKK
ncbi:heme lyase CcmF/NrfE family subunit [Alphaproteobacteria bacterium]|nr:heme lyase CcmF/NrfE family subunit [Alphaproteobacteria bacterium]